MASKEQCGDVGKEEVRKKQFIPDERDMLRWKNYILQETVGEGTYSKVKVSNSKRNLQFRAVFAVTK